MANIGDSRCLLYSKGEAINMSDDHKPELFYEKKRIERAGGSIVSGRVNGCLNLSRSLGDFSFKKNRELKPEE